MPNAQEFLEKSKKQFEERKAQQTAAAEEAKKAAAAKAAANAAAAKAAANAALRKPSAIQIKEQQDIRQKKMQEIAKQAANRAAKLNTETLQQTIQAKNKEISTKTMASVIAPSPSSPPAPSAPPANKPAQPSAPSVAAAAKTNQTTNTTVAAVVGTTLFSSTPMSGGDALKIILVILCVGIVIYFIIKSRIIQNAYNKISSVPNDSNNASIRRDELTALSPQADEMAQQRVGVFEGFKARIDRFVNGGAAKEGFLTASDLPTLPQMPTAITNVVSNLPTLPKPPTASASGVPPTANTMRVVDSEQALVNYSVLGCRCAGYLGPKMNGVFSEEDAIQLAIKMGCRLFIFDIDYLDRAPSTPVLVCRDANGNLLSNNVGSIAKAAASIAAFTKKQRLASTDPIIIVLSVRRLPNKSATSKESIAFMQEIAAQLVPIQQYLMRSAPQGDVQQQRLEEVLFKLPIKTFENQMLLLSNLDTRGFRQLDIEVAPARNLDILVHARVYTNENSALFYYSLPAKSATAAAVVQTQEYYENIPPANYESEADKTRNTWSMSMTAELEGAPDAAVLDVLVNQLGVQGIVIDPFADGVKESAVYTPEFFARRSYIPKPAEIAYKEPSVVTIAPPDKRLDANGGMLVSPNV